MEPTTWLDHDVYTIQTNDAGYLEVKLLRLDTCTPEIVNDGWDTVQELHASIKQTYGESAMCLPPSQFQKEVDRRTRHSAETLEMLTDTYAGDLRESWVYGSILRPMTGIHIERAIYLNAHNAMFGMWKLHDYVVAPGPLDARTIEHYDLVFISHP